MIRLPAEPLRSGSTRLRPWRESDAPALARAGRDPELARWTRIPPGFGEVDARFYILHRLDGLRNNTQAAFAIVADENDQNLLGAVSLLRFDWPHQRAEVGYWLVPEARGGGHATKALGLVSEWGFASLGLGRLTIMIEPENTRSLAVPERAGFRREGNLRSYVVKGNRRLDLVVFGRLRDDRSTGDGPGRRDVRT